MLYLPVLIAARAVMTSQTHDPRLDGETDHDETVPWLLALAMAAGVTLIGVPRASSPWFWPGIGVGTTLVFQSYSCVLPDGALCLVPGRRAGIVTLLWVCAFFLTLDYSVAPSTHSVSGLTPTQAGRALTAGGIGQSAVAIVCGARLARKSQVYRRRTILAAVFFVAGMMLVVITVLEKTGWWGLSIGYGVVSTGMGLAHLDTTNRIVTDLVEPDGITHTQAITAMTITGAAGGAVLGTVTTASVAPAAADVEPGRS